MKRLLVFVLILLGGGAPAMASLPAEVSLAVGETVLLMADLRRAALGSGKVVSIATPEAGQLLLFGESPGETTAELWLKDGSHHQLRIRVRAPEPARRLQQVRELMHGADSVSARLTGQYVVLEGSRATAADQQRASEVASLFPGEVLNFAGSSGWESMVQMQVKIIEVRRDELTRLGIRWDGEAAGPGVFAAVGGAAGGVSLTASMSSQLLSRIDLLLQRGLAHTLAEPVLSCRSGGIARFVSGGEIPIPVTDGLGAVDVQYKEYGVILEVRPRADRDGIIFADVDVELSQVDASVRAGDFPGFLKRRTSTALNAQDGETVAIAGLILREQGRDRSAVPGLSRMRVAGGLFRSTRRTQRETELVVLITPRRFESGVESQEPVIDQQTLLERGRQIEEAFR